MGHCRVIIHHSSIKQLKRGNQRMCIKRIYQTSWTWRQWKCTKKIFVKQRTEYFFKAHTSQRVIRHDLKSIPPPSCMLPGMRSERDWLRGSWLRGMKGSWFSVRPRLTSHVHHLPGEENKIYCSQNKTDTGRTDKWHYNYIIWDQKTLINWLISAMRGPANSQIWSEDGGYKLPRSEVLPIIISSHACKLETAFLILISR